MSIYKVGHFTDQHLGYSSGKRVDRYGVNLRLIDGYEAYNTCVKEMIEHEVDICVSSGDVFHSANPDTRTVVVAQDGFRKLSENGIPVYNITGNHDTNDIRAELPANKILDDPKANIHSYIEPYIVEEALPGVYFHFLSHHAYTDQEDTMKSIKLIDGAMNILVSHGSCYDTNMNVILHSPQEPREVIIPQDIMDLDWDYTWLGHIHERQFISSTDGVSDTSGRKQFYGGSLIRRGFSDALSKLGRGWTLWTIDTEKKTVIPEFFNIPQRPQYDCDILDVTKMTPHEIEDAIKLQGQTIYEELKNEEGYIDDELAPIVRQTIKGLSSVDYVAINWKEAYKYNEHFLTHTLRKMEIESLLNDTSKDNETSKENMEAKAATDIITAFSEWFDEAVEKEETLEEDDKKVIKSKGSKFLKQGKDSVLDNGN